MWFSKTLSSSSPSKLQFAYALKSKKKSAQKERLEGSRGLGGLCREVGQKRLIKKHNSLLITKCSFDDEHDDDDLEDSTAELVVAATTTNGTF